jgi:hypothetical protein
VGTILAIAASPQRGILWTFSSDNVASRYDLNSTSVTRGRLALQLPLPFPDGGSSCDQTMFAPGSLSSTSIPSYPEIREEFDGTQFTPSQSVQSTVLSNFFSSGQTVSSTFSDWTDDRDFTEHWADSSTIHIPQEDWSAVQNVPHAPTAFVEDAESEHEDLVHTDTVHGNGSESITADHGPKLFACPYLKNNPDVYRHWEICRDRGWPSMHRVK